jgi:hypothetical protein
VIGARDARREGERKETGATLTLGAIIGREDSSDRPIASLQRGRIRMGKKCAGKSQLTLLSDLPSRVARERKRMPVLGRFRSMIVAEVRSKLEMRRRVEGLQRESVCPFLRERWAVCGHYRPNTRNDEVKLR